MMEEMATADVLQGLQVLVVEDELLVSLMLEGMLADLGCEVTGTARRVTGAMKLVSEGDFRIAVLDVNIAGEKVYPVAEMLAKRGVPFIFSTGYGVAGIDTVWKSRPVVQKPFTQRDLARALTTAFSSR